MFTGIVAEVGRIERVEPLEQGRRLVVRAGEVLAGLDVGDSIALNGACLTAVAVGEGWFAAEAVHETLIRTNLGELEPGSGVDLERPMAAAGRFDGHIVQGHVDGVGTIASVVGEGESRRIRVTCPPGLLRYVAEKGSITVDGISLTVTAVDPAGFEVVLIPHTLEVTVLGEKGPGDRVNLEVDILAKYVERLVAR